MSNGSECGRSKRGIMAEVVEWRREGVSEEGERCAEGDAERNKDMHRERNILNIRVAI